MNQSSLNKTQIRRSRSRSVGRRSSRVQRQKKISLYEQTHQDPAYFDEMVYCQKCDRQTACIIQKKGGNLAWFFCAVFSLVGGLCLSPFFCDGCLDAQIICMECNTLKRVDQAGIVR